MVKEVTDTHERSAEILELGKKGKTRLQEVADYDLVLLHYSLLL